IILKSKPQKSSLQLFSSWGTLVAVVALALFIHKCRFHAGFLRQKRGVGELVIAIIGNCHNLRARQSAVRARVSKGAKFRSSWRTLGCDDPCRRWRELIIAIIGN